MTKIAFYPKAYETKDIKSLSKKNKCISFRCIILKLPLCWESKKWVNSLDIQKVTFGYTYKMLDGYSLYIHTVDQ